VDALVLREQPMRMGVPLAAPVVIEAVAEFDPEPETPFAIRLTRFPRRPQPPERGRGRRWAMSRASTCRPV